MVNFRDMSWQGGGGGNNTQQQQTPSFQQSTKKEMISGEGKKSSKIVIRFNEAKAVQKQQQHSSSSSSSSSSENQSNDNNNSELATTATTKAAVLASAAAVAATTSSSSSSSSESSSWKNWFSIFSSSKSSDSFSSSSSSSSQENIPLTKEQQQREEEAQRAAARVKAAVLGKKGLPDTDDDADAASKQQTNDFLANVLGGSPKTTSLAKTLGRNPSSVSYSELDTVVTDFDWKKLPASPISAMQLTEKGLYDADVGRYYDCDDLRDLINRAGKLEAVVQNQADTRLLGTAQQRMMDLSLIAGPYGCLAMTIWFWVLKLPQAFLQGYPRRSVLLTKYYEKHLDTLQIEELCQKKRVLMTATNPRVLAMMVFGAVGLAGYFIGNWAANKPSLFKQTSTMTTKDGQHFEGTMKWLFSVYYHHPAYSEEAHARRSRSLQQNTPVNLAVNDPKTPMLNKRRNAWEAEFPNR